MATRTVLVPMELSNNQVIRVEAVVVSGDEEVGDATRKFEEMLGSLQGAIQGLVQSVGTALAGITLKKKSLELGLEVGLESGQLVTLLVKGSSKANLKLTIEW